MREPSPRSGETERKSPGCSESCIALMSNCASKWLWSEPREYAPSVESASPAASARGLANVMSSKQPLVTALEMRKLCALNPGTPKLLDTSWSYTAHPAPAAPVDVHPSIPYIVLSAVYVGVSKSTETELSANANR